MVSPPYGISIKDKVGIRSSVFAKNYAAICSKKERKAKSRQ